MALQSWMGLEREFQTSPPHYTGSLFGPSGTSQEPSCDVGGPARPFSPRHEQSGKSGQQQQGLGHIGYAGRFIWRMQAVWSREGAIQTGRRVQLVVRGSDEGGFQSL